MLVSKKILSFYKSLLPPRNLPNSMITLNPYQTTKGWQTTEQFYSKYYADQSQRHILFGINPGRFGGGITGVPFTDPLLLETVCGIPNDFHKKSELSSTFVYEVIQSYGGPDSFFSKFFITGISPLGYIQNGKNLNYYDLKDWKSIFKKDIIFWIKAQLEFSINTNRAYSVGKGQNLTFLLEINKEHNFFKEVVPLPHPRWVMQYRLNRKSEFIDEYVSKLSIR